MKALAPRAIVVAAAGFFCVTGAWSFAAPRSFYDLVATYPPYNEHLFHDIGAFQIGLGVALVAGLLWDSGLGVALAGGAVAAVGHAVAHALDTDLGGRATDPLSLGLLAALLILALVLHLRSAR